MVNAARKYDRIVQCGTQHRSEDLITQAIKWVREGNLGIMDFYRMRNVEAGTDMRKTIAGDQNKEAGQKGK